MIKLIYKNFILDIVKFFLISTISITLIVWVIQAVNYLDFVSEDGHGFRVYFLYTLLSIPKIFSRLIIFLFFISIFFIISKYEDNNEILVFWSHGVKKINLINAIIFSSIFFILIQLIFNNFIVPKSQDMARSYIRDSNIDYFPSLLRPKQFIDTVENLTIFYEKRNSKGEYENIFLKDNIGVMDSKIISAKKGYMSTKDDNFFLILDDGNISNVNQKNINSFTFKSTEINLSKFKTKTTVFPKIQELSTETLISCLKSFYFFNKGFSTPTFYCDKSSIEIIVQEIYKRNFKPIFLILLSLIASCLIIKSKDVKHYFKFKTFIFIFGVINLIIAEVSGQFVGFNNDNNLYVLLYPVILFLSIYLFLAFRGRSMS